MSIQYSHQSGRTTARLWSALRVVSLTTASALLSANAAQATLELRVMADREPIETTPVEVNVTVTDASGNPVLNLDAGAFQLEEDGAAQPISGFSPPIGDANRHISVIFAMDISGSIRNAPGAYDAMKQAVIDFINNQMRPGDVGAVIKFDGEVAFFDPPGFTSDKVQLIRAVRLNKVVQERTAFFDGVARAVDLLANNTTLPPGPRAVIVLSDGKDSGSQMTYEAFQDKLNEANIPVFPIAFGSEEVIEDEVLQFVADATHGKYYSANPQDFAPVYNAIGEQLQNEYRLTYNSVITDCNPHTLKVTVQTPEGPLSTEQTFSRCFPQNAPPPTDGGVGGNPPPDGGTGGTPPPSDTNPPAVDEDGGGGGGGSLGLIEGLGLVTLAGFGLARRRLKITKD